jgi:integrase
VKRTFDAACKAAGIQRLVPHRLRATYATWLSEAGVPIQDIQAALGHKDIRTTAIYLGVDLGRVAAAQRRVAARTGLGGIKSGASIT